MRDNKETWAALHAKLKLIRAHGTASLGEEAHLDADTLKRYTFEIRDEAKTLVSKMNR